MSDYKTRCICDKKLLKGATGNVILNNEEAESHWIRNPKMVWKFNYKQ